MALRSIWHELLDCNRNPTARFSSTKGLRMDPSPEDTPKSSFSKKTFIIEVMSCLFQTAVGVDLQVRGWQSVGLRSWVRSALSIVQEV